MKFLKFLVLSHHYSTSSGEMGQDFAHDHDHDHVHAHDCRIKLYSLQGMVKIQLDKIGIFSLVAHYFVQLLEDMILALNI